MNNFAILIDKWFLMNKNAGIAPAFFIQLTA
jgi:hypothetical protein